MQKQLGPRADRSARPTSRQIYCVGEGLRQDLPIGDVAGPKLRIDAHKGQHHLEPGL